MNKAIFFGILFLNVSFCFAQFSPQLNMSSSKSRGEYGLSYGFFPFRGDDELKGVYNGDYESVTSSFSQLQLTSISLATNTSNSNSIYVDLLSYTPGSSWGRFSFGSQLTQSDIGSDTLRSYESIATKKLLNGGGNMNINFNRPIIYAPFTDNNTSYFLVNASVTAYMDVKRLNSSIYNPGIGTQFNIDFDLRLLSNRSDVMIGNVCRMGVRGRYLYNAFDKKYSEQFGIQQDLSNLSILAVTGYLGIGPVYIEIGKNFSNNDIIAPAKNVLKITLQPVKF